MLRICKLCNLFGWILLTSMMLGCAYKLKIKVPDSTPHQIGNPGSGMFRAGAAKVDITPPPGYPMGGYSIAGKFSRGWWTRLYAKAIYLEDKDGTGIVLVSCDLWSIPAGLADRVAELIAKQHRFLGREQIILAATHTHTSPGNFSTAQAYNTGASPASGFDESLFEFLAKRITLSIAQAINSRGEAKVKIGTTQLIGLSRNRSLEAFKQNSMEEQNAIIQQVPEDSARAIFTEFRTVATISSYQAFQAVDPQLTTLQIERNGAPIAIAAFFAVHPTATGPETEVYSSDIFGVAENIVEQHLAAESNVKNPVVAIFNGAEGDISPNWKNQDRNNTVRLGRMLAKGIIRTLNSTNRLIQGPINYRFKVVEELKGQLVKDIRGDAKVLGLTQTPIRLATCPYPGAPTLGGAEDGRTFLYHYGLREGVKSNQGHGPQGNKVEATGDLFQKLLGIDSKSLIVKTAQFVKNLTGVARLPNKLPLGIYSIGPVVLATLPGEFTVTMGKRIEERLGGDGREVILIGLANEYLSYFTTPLEYNAQHYEGASTMYGQFAGPFIEQQLSKIAKQTPNKNSSHERKYKVGPKRDFSISQFESDHQTVLEEWRLAEGLRNLMQDGHSGFLERDFPKITWWDYLYAVDTTQSDFNKPINPTVTIEVKKDVNWRTFQRDPHGLDSMRVNTHLETDTTSFNFITVIDSIANNQARWRAIWLVPTMEDPSQTIRFRIKPPRGESKCSQPFRVQDIIGSRKQKTMSAEIELASSCN